MVKKPKLLFIYEIEDERFWKDGLYEAINILDKSFNVLKFNLKDKDKGIDSSDFDFVLGWGAFGSAVDTFIQSNKDVIKKKGLCIAGNAFSPMNPETYDVLFYETDWYKPQIDSHKNIVHAFGINSQIFKPLKTLKLWDYLTVGAFAKWKRQWLICERSGTKMAIGQIQMDNMQESIGIVGNLIVGASGVSGMVLPEELVKFYNSAKTVYIPANINGGGERAVLEARACGIKVEIEEDNLKLKELLTSTVWDEKYYARKLEGGILSCLKVQS